MKKLIGLSVLVFLLLLYGIYLSLYQFKIRQPGIEATGNSPYFDYRGITNVHSNASSGSGSYPEILKYAKNSKFDFIIFTEVSLPARPFFIEGYFQDMLVLAGGMYSYFDSSLLYYGGTSDMPPTGNSQTQVFFADLVSQPHNEENGFVVLAHPFYGRFTWKGDYPPGFDGVEIINLKSILAKTWKENKFRSIASLLLYPFNPNLAFINIFSTPNDELVLWDQLNKKHFVSGFAGNDTHAKIPLWGEKFIKFPSYESSFNLVSNHILTQTELTGEFTNDKAKVLKALKSGQFYMCLDFLGNPKGFYTEMREDEKTYPMGSKVKLKKNLKLIIEMPSDMRAPFQINILKDGEQYYSSNAQKANFTVTAPGRYRVEIKINPKIPLIGSSHWMPWIYTNNFYVEN